MTALQEQQHNWCVVAGTCFVIRSNNSSSIGQPQPHELNSSSTCAALRHWYGVLCCA